MLIPLLVGLAMTAVSFTLAGRRVAMLYRLARTAQPVEPGRVQGGAAGVLRTLRAELGEVLTQRRVIRWTVPGVAHVAVFWGFLILLLTLIERYGALFQRDFAIPVIGRWAVVGFVEDLAIVSAFVAVATFATIRWRRSPQREGRRSRFFGSHSGAAWFVLCAICVEMATLLFYRAAQVNTGYFPYRHGAFASEEVARWLKPLGHGTNDVLEPVGILVAIGVVLGFLVFVVHSKHMHIFLAPVNVALARRPRALGALLPVHSGGKRVDFDDPGEDDLMGRGKIEDFTWKGLLDFATCTECGRCQSVCPAWNTGKALSPKLVVMALRDHALAKAPCLLAASDEERAALPAEVRAEGERPLVASPEDGGVIDPAALWACTTCGACVEQCPVDVEHVDHIVDMRRHQMLYESEFPEEAGGMLRNLEHAGDPWGRGQSARMEWARELPFPVRVVGEGEPDQLPDDVEYLYWVGCAAALDETAQQTARAVTELLHRAGVSFMVMGGAETCCGDSARRMGHEALFLELARTNIETLDNAGVHKVVTTCAHCFNTLANEYPQLGGTYEVVHHTELLARLVAEGRLAPTAPVEATVAYHDACYLGRHNGIYDPPRNILTSIPGVRVVDLPRSRERSFCCGAGGARMWMDENDGTRINVARTDEALALKPDLITAACPYCIAMLTDGVGTRRQQGAVGDEVQVTDVAQVLLRSTVTSQEDKP